MKVVVINGSPKKNGNTAQALKMVSDVIEAAGHDITVLHVGNKVVRGCIGCAHCFKSKDNCCVFKDDILNEYIQEIKDADGILIGSPVHFAAIAGTMKSFLDRLFYVGAANPGLLTRKVGASVVAVRRSGGIPTFNQLNVYLHYEQMMVPSSNYWNVIHGLKAGDVQKDEEGVQIMEVLGQNFVTALKDRETRVEEPPLQDKILYNFIRE